MPEPHAIGAAAPDTVAFHCEGCGDHVFAFGIAAPPAHGLCSVCAWLCEEVPDPEQMMRLRRMLRLAQTRAAGSARGEEPHGGLG